MCSARDPETSIPFCRQIRGTLRMSVAARERTEHDVKISNLVGSIVAQKKLDSVRCHDVNLVFQTLRST